MAQSRAGSTVETDSMMLRIGPSWFCHPKLKFFCWLWGGVDLGSIIMTAIGLRYQF